MGEIRTMMARKLSLPSGPRSMRGADPRVGPQRALHERAVEVCAQREHQHASRVGPKRPDRREEVAALTVGATAAIAWAGDMPRSE